LNVATLRALQLDALPIFRLHRLFVAPMVCNAPISRYSLRCRICYHRLHGYLKPCRSSICAPLFNTVLFAPYSAPFRVCRYPFRVSSVYLPRCVRRCRFPRIVPRFGVRVSVVKERARRTERLCKSMQTNPLTHRRTPVFIGVFAHSTFFHVEHSAQNPAFGAVSHSDEFRRMEQRATRHTHTPRTHATHASAHERTPTRQRTRQRTHMHTRAPTHERTHASRTHTHAHARARAPCRPHRRQSGTVGTSARAPSAMQSSRLHPWCNMKRAMQSEG